MARAPKKTGSDALQVWGAALLVLVSLGMAGMALVDVVVIFVLMGLFIVLGQRVRRRFAKTPANPRSGDPRVRRRSYPWAIKVLRSDLAEDQVRSTAPPAQTPMRTASWVAVVGGQPRAVAKCGNFRPPGGRRFPHFRRTVEIALDHRRKSDA